MDKNLREFFVALGRGVVLPTISNGTSKDLGNASDRVFAFSFEIRLIGKMVEIHLLCWALYLGNFLQKKIYSFSL